MFMFKFSCNNPAQALLYIDLFTFTYLCWRKPFNCYIAPWNQIIVLTSGIIFVKLSTFLSKILITVM